MKKLLCACVSFLALSGCVAEYPGDSYGYYGYGYDYATGPYPYDAYYESYSIRRHYDGRYYGGGRWHDRDWGATHNGGGRVSHTAAAHAQASGEHGGGHGGEHH